MLNPFIHLISNIISLVNIALIAWVILGFLIHLDVANRQNPMVAKLYDTLSKLINPVLSPIRAYLKKRLPNLEVDLSPVILLLLLHFLDNALYSWFYSI